MTGVGDHRWQQRDGEPESWEAPWELVGQQTGGFTEVTVAIDFQARLTLVATSQIGRDVWLQVRVPPDLGWGSWSRLATVPTGPVQSPSLHIGHPGELELLLRTPSTGGLYQLSQTEPDGGWKPGRQWPSP